MVICAKKGGPTEGVETFPFNTVISTTNGVGDMWKGINGISYGEIYDMLAVSDTEVYAGGNFATSIGGAAVPYLAKWNGSAWSALGTAPNGSISYMCRVGTDLWVAGGFSAIGGLIAPNTYYVAKWNGSSWSNGCTNNSSISGLREMLTDGTDVFVIGSAGLSSVMFPIKIGVWRGANWAALGAGTTDNNVLTGACVNGATLAVCGNTPFTFAGVSFPAACGTIGTNGTGVTAFPAIPGSSSGKYAIMYNPTRSAYWVGGTDGLHEYDGSTWRKLSTFTMSAGNSITRMWWHAATSSALVCGPFSYVDGVPCYGLVKWSAGKWTNYVSTVPDPIYGPSYGTQINNIGSLIPVKRVSASASGKLWLSTLGYGFTGSWSGVQNEMNGSIIRVTPW